MSNLNVLRTLTRGVVLSFFLISASVAMAQGGMADDQSAALVRDLEEAMGGRSAYDELRIIRWNFFGFRDLVWDKHTGDVRIDVARDSTTYLFNLNSGKGKVRSGDETIEHPDSLAKALDQAHRMWINDSYWLVMPWKLRDQGVTLKYLDTGETEAGEAADVLSMTFSEVGVTPQNKYHIWITKDEKLLKQWAFYPSASDADPRAIWPWDNYQVVEGDLKLSFDRSDDKGPKDVRVYQQVTPSVFTDFDRPDDF